MLLRPCWTRTAHCGSTRSWAGRARTMGSGMVLDTSGDCYLVGSEDATWGSAVRPYTGDWDGFVAKISPSVVAAPVLASLLPGGANAGDPALLLTVVGSGFVDGAVVTWDGSDRPTTFVSSSEVDGTIDARTWPPERPSR